MNILVFFFLVSFLFFVNFCFFVRFILSNEFFCCVLNFSSFYLTAYRLGISIPLQFAELSLTWLSSSMVPEASSITAKETSNAVSTL